MKILLSVLTLGLTLSFGTAHAASHTGAAPMTSGGPGCDAQAMQKKLAGAAKTSFLKKCEADSASAMASISTSAAAACDKSAADKKLSGAAKTSHIKKCVADAGGPTAACDKSAADKKLSGAAKTSHLKKCMEDSTTTAEAKTTDARPVATAKAASAKK